MTGSHRLAALRRALSSIVFGRLILLLVILVFWEVYAQFFADRALLPAPSKVVAAVGPKIFGDPAVFAAIRLTLYELAIAFALSIVIGLAIGISLGLSEFGRNGVLPIVLLLYAIPQVVLLPLVVMMFGIGPTSKIVFGFSHGVFPVILTTVAGMRSVSPLLLRGEVHWRDTKATDPPCDTEGEVLVGVDQDQRDQRDERDEPEVHRTGEVRMRDKT